MTGSFDNIKVGDTVALPMTAGFHRRIIGYRTLQVERVTKTQFVAGGANWRKSDGYRVGRIRQRVLPWTDELRSEADHVRCVLDAESACRRAAKLLDAARDDEALRLAALLPDELKGGAA